MVDHYIQRKHEREPVVYMHPLMKGTLEATYGIMLYQEQIMQLTRELARLFFGRSGYSQKGHG